MSSIETFETVAKKIVTQPLIPVANSWVDAVPFVLLFVFFAISSLLLWKYGKHELARWSMRFISAFVFIILLHRCLCVVRGFVFGIRQVGRDEIRAFGELCIFVPIAGFSLSMGRVFCGWICPLGFLQEIAGKLSRLKDKKLGESVSKVLNISLIGITILATFWFLKWFRPSTDFFTENVAVFFSIGLLFTLPFAIISRKLSLKLRKVRYLWLAVWIILGFFIVFVTNPWCILYGGELDYSAMLAFLAVLSASFIVPLAWCRYVCPLGASLSILTRASLFKIQGSGECRGCERCDDVCIAGALENGKIDLPSCIYCGRCLRGCVGKLEKV